MRILNGPVYTVNNRILPDINILVSHSLSRLIELGHFTGYEIVIPRLLMHVVDNTNNRGIKIGISEEIETLKKIERDGLIKVMDYDDKLDTSNLTEKNEDEYISLIADITNSILLTGDEVLKSRVQLKNRPIIFIAPDYHSKIKNLFNSLSAN